LDATLFSPGGNKKPVEFSLTTPLRGVYGTENPKNNSHASLFILQLFQLYARLRPKASALSYTRRLD
jgi:hypothetical protein